MASLRSFRLPGGDAAIKEPRRAALGLCHELAAQRTEVAAELRRRIAAMFAADELRALEQALVRSINAPRCSSIGRLFDAVAALVGLRTIMRFEGQAAMELEFALEGIESSDHYPLPLDSRHALLVLDWAPIIAAILTDLQRGAPIGLIAAKFHNGLAEGIVSVAKQVNEPRLALGGGCFQNRYLLKQTIRRLREEGFQVFWPQRVPPNDGGIAFGQIAVARHGQPTARR